MARRVTHRKYFWEKKKMSDEIIQELWQTKDRIAKQFDYDIRALAT
jgi:hypothetical protein